MTLKDNWPFPPVDITIMAGLRNNWSGVGLVVAVMVLATGIELMRHWESQLSLNWDFSQQHSLASIPWPASYPADTYCWEQRPIRCSIRIDETRSYRNDDVAAVYATRRGSELDSVTVDEHPSTAGQAARRAAGLIRLWGGDPTSAEVWRQTAVPGSVVSYTMVLRGSAHSPDISVEIFPAVATPSRPWHVMVQLYWKDTTNSGQQTDARGR